MANYIWSDLHLSHKNIIKYCNRPFEDNLAGVVTMNETLIKNWKETITNNDTLFNLGDFCFYWQQQFIKQTLETLPGKKVLILGNHDRNHNLQWWMDAGFDEVYPYPIIYKNFFILSHENVFLNESMPYVNIHGHIHQNKLDSKQYINVSVEQINYKPISLDKIVEEHSFA